MKITKITHRWIGVQNGVFYLLLVVVWGLLAYLGQHFAYQFDWTYGQRNSLSATTQTLLSALDKPLKFTVYIPDRPELQADVTALLEKYQHIKPDTTFEFVNPDLEPDRAKKDGIEGAGQIAIHLGDRSEVVAETDEATIANALQRMSRDGERLVLFVEGHGERAPLAEGDKGMMRLVTLLERNGFKIQPHHLLRSPTIPDNARFIVIAAPQQDLLAGEVDVLKQYVARGGNILWLQEPDGLHGLQPLASVLGVHVSTGTLLDADSSVHAQLGINHPAVMPVIDYAAHPITQRLQSRYSLFPFATAVDLDANDVASAADQQKWQSQALLTSAPTSWLETSGTLTGAVNFNEGTEDQAGPLTVGVALQREITTTNAKPRQQRAVVLGDSDFMLNGFIGYGANLDLAVGLFNWLSADDNLVNIPVVRAPDTQFNMHPTVYLSLAGFFLFILPLGLIVVGTYIWYRRRRR